MTNDIPRRDFFDSLDLQFDEGEIIDMEECEILFLYFLEITPNPLLTIFKNFKMDYSDLHKIFLIRKIEEYTINDLMLFDYIVRDSSFSTLDLLSLLPVSFYKPFCAYISKKHLFFLDTILEYNQTLEVFEDSSLWIPFPFLNGDMDLVYNIIKKMICQNTKIKDNFINSINEIIKSNQERNKMVHNKEKVITDEEAYNLNTLINLFMNKIISNRISLKGKFSNFVFTSKIEIFKLSYVKMIEERKMLKMEEEETREIDELLKNIVNEKAFGEYLGELITTDQLSHLTVNTSLDDTMNSKLFESCCTVYLYLYEFFPPEYSVLSLLFEHDIHKQHILRILVHNPNIIKFSLLNKIIEYYNKIQKEGHKIEIRYLINLILVENTSLTLRICPRNIKFINYLMSDFEYCLSMGLSGIRDMNEVLNKLHKFTDFDFNDEIKNLVMEVRILKNKISSSFIFIDTCFALLTKIINNYVELLLVDELILVFVKILNCNMRTIVGKKCSQLIIRNPFINKKNPLSKINKESLKFKPKELLRNILLIYIGIKEDKFIKTVCTEEMYFDVELFKTGLEICENKYLINNSQISELRNLISKFNTYNVDEIELSDDEFIDPLTYNIIKEPVKLLTSNITIDKSTYNMIMLNDGIDPFNREPLDETKVVEDKEMKKKMEMLRKK